MTILFVILATVVAVGIFDGISTVIQSRYDREMDRRRWNTPAPAMLRYRERGAK